MSAVREGIKVAGGPAKVAKELGVSVQAVCFWRDGERKLPEFACPTLERMTSGRFTCEALREGAPWHRIPDPTWPHPKGRPLLDPAAAPTKEPT